jgi:hypothetical protein
MKIKEGLTRFLNLVESFREQQVEQGITDYNGYKKLFNEPYFQAFLKTSPFMLAVYNYPSQRYDFVSESVSQLCILKPEDFLEDSVEGVMKAMDETGRRTMIDLITPHVLRLCVEYAEEIKNLKFNVCIQVYKTKTVKK